MTIDKRTDIIRGQKYIRSQGQLKMYKKTKRHAWQMGRQQRGGKEEGKGR